MAKHTLLTWLEKWAAENGRFRDNSDFEIAEDDYREFSTDIGDTFFRPIDELLTRVDKLEHPAPEPVEGVHWDPAPKVSVGDNGTDVKVTACKGLFDGFEKAYTASVVHQAPKPQEGTTRVDILAATATGWYYIYGEEDGVTPPFEHADDPTTKLLFAAYLIWTSAGATVEDTGKYVKTVNGQAPDASGNVQVVSGKVDTVNGLQPDASKNILLEGQHIKSTANLWSYIGLASSTALITLKGWLDFLTNKVKLNEEAIALRIKQIKQGTTTYSPDANGLVTLPEASAAVTVDPALSTTSENPVQNKIITAEISPLQAQAIAAFDPALTLDRRFKDYHLGTLTGDVQLTLTGTHKTGSVTKVSWFGNGTNQVLPPNGAKNDLAGAKAGLSNGQENEIWLTWKKGANGASRCSYTIIKPV